MSYFGLKNVTVILHWTQVLIASYKIIVSPQTALMFSGNASVQLVVSYNTLYNVSVVASLCGQTMSNNFELYYDGKACSRELTLNIIIQ